MMLKNLQTTWKMAPVLDVNVVPLTKHSLIESNILTVTGTAQIRIIEKMKLQCAKSEQFYQKCQF